MRKKLIYLSMGIAFVFLLSGCGKKIFVNSDLTTLTLTAGEEYNLVVVTNDDKGLIFNAADLSVLSVDATGKIKALSAGVTKVDVTSKTDASKKHQIEITVYKAVTIQVSNSNVALVTGEKATNLASSLDDTLLYESSNKAIFEVDATGEVTAKTAGTATLIIKSSSNPQVSSQIIITVTKYVQIDVDAYQVLLLNGGTKKIEFTASEAVYLESSNPSIVTVNDLGVLVAKGIGEATIKIITNADHSIFEEVKVYVFDNPTSISILANAVINVGNKTEVKTQIYPEQGFPTVILTSSDDSIAYFNDDNQLVAKKLGVVTITATSFADQTVIKTMSIEITHKMLVDATVKSGTKEQDGITYTHGIDLFETVLAAVDASSNGATIIVNPGTYSDPLRLDTSVNLLGLGARITNTIEVLSNDITIKGFLFDGNAQIKNDAIVSNLVIENNTFSNLSKTAILLNGVSGLSIINNKIDNITGDGISVTDIRSGLVMIKSNTITKINDGLVITALSAYTNTKVEVAWNKIDTVNKAVSFNLEASALTTKAFFRFNKVSNYTKAAIQGSTDNVDFTLNYWGGAIDIAKFTNINAHQLRGFYTNELAVIQEVNYNPLIPVTIEILNPIDELIIGETHTFQYEMLPLDIDTTRIRWITSAPTIATVTNGSISTLKSGEVTVSLRSTIDVSISGSTSFIVTTTPGIELSLPEARNQVLVGDNLKINATSFPYNVKNKPLLYTSSDVEVATIDQLGNVVALKAGSVTFRAEFIEDAGVFQTFKLEVYNALNDNDLLDLLTKSMVTYATPREWLVFGTGFNYTDYKYDSVSRYLFDGLTINQSKMLPISTGIRPGILKPAHPAGVPTYNPENIYWIVIHETANTSPQSGALSHANYLYNAAMSGTVLNTSWHFTMDDKQLYQHVPLNEIAYHAGDGSTLPKVSTVGNETAYGGGNRNGIGIETSVAVDGDNYRVWHRTAKLAAQLMVEYNLPMSQLAYHKNFSGKICPQSLLTGNLIWLFEELAHYEYQIKKFHDNATISFESHNTEYLDNTGRVIKLPDRAMTVSYTVTVIENNVTKSRTFHTYLPGTVH